MKCPYCAEDIKDEAMVCRHCHRDLTLFKPIDHKIEELKSEVASLTECVTKMAAFLDRYQIKERLGDNSDETMKRKKPGFWGRFFFAFLEFVLVVLLLFVITGVDADLGPRPQSVFDHSGLELISSKEARQRYEDRLNLLGKAFVVGVFALPIGLGVWIGLRWPGRNLKNYILTGLAAWIPDALLLTLLIVVSLADGSKPPGVITLLLLIMTIDLFRCLFGFTTGGLIGDWIERRRHPQFYSRGFSESLTTLRRNQARGFDRVTLGFGRLTSSMAPVIPLIGVIITSMVGFYTAQTAARKAGQPTSPPATASPTPRSSPSG